MVKIDDFVSGESVIILKFNQPVNPEQILANIMLNVEKEKKRASTLCYSGEQLILVPFTDIKVSFLIQHFIYELCFSLFKVSGNEASNLRDIMNTFHPDNQQSWIFFKATTPFPMESRIRFSLYGTFIPRTL